jgi:hypothetical protein
LFEDAIHLFQFEKPELIFHRRSLADSIRLLMDRQNGLKSCLSLLESAKELTNRDGLKSKLSDLEIKVQAELDHLKTRHDQQYQQFTSSESTGLKALREHWLELEILHKTDDQVGEVAFPTDLRAEIKKRITEDTRDLLDECIDYLANQDSTNEEVLGYFNQLIQRSEQGVSEDWQAFLTTSSDDNQHSKMMIYRVRELYLAGKSTEALNILNGFNPETSDLNRWLDLKSKLHEVEVFQAWAGNFNLEDVATDIINQKLDQVSRFVGYQLPMKYWVKSRVPKIVGEYYHNSYKKLISSQGYDQATFFDNLKRFLRVEYLVQTMPQEIAPMLPELEGTRRR